VDTDWSITKIVIDLGHKIGNKFREGHGKTMENVFCLGVDCSRASRHDISRSKSPLQFGVGARGDNGICVGILVSNYIGYFLHRCLSIGFQRLARQAQGKACLMAQILGAIPAELANRI
jgi:hypothetical protein